MVQKQSTEFNIKTNVHRVHRDTSSVHSVTFCLFAVTKCTFT